VATGIEAEAGQQPAPAKVFTFPPRQPAAETRSDEPEKTQQIADETAEDDDELLLGSDDILTSPVGSAPIAPPEDEDEAPQPTASTTGGGTLFERMSNIARGAPKAQIEDEEQGYRADPIDIPRFLNRQNNQ
jgi:cell division protein FtsZ